MHSLRKFRKEILRGEIPGHKNLALRREFNRQLWNFRQNKQRLAGGGGNTALIVVDVQNCFLPGGGLPVMAGKPPLVAVADLRKQEERRKELLENIKKAIADEQKQYKHMYFTKDMHPPGHISFNRKPKFTETENKDEAKYLIPGVLTRKYKYTNIDGDGEDRTHIQRLWPKHCQNPTPPETPPATKVEALDDEEFRNPQSKASADEGGINLAVKKPTSTKSSVKVHEVYKGTDLNVDSYSAIFDALGRKTPYTVNEQGDEVKPFVDDLKYNKFTEIHVCGIARNVCVYFTFEDLIKARKTELTDLKKIVFLYDATLPVVEGVPGLDFTHDDIISGVKQILKETSQKAEVAKEGNDVVVTFE